MIKRQSHITKRFQKMQGLDVSEKGVLVNLGELIDGIINNRTPTNPQLQGKTRINPKLPPPTTITNEPGVKSAKLTWPAVDSSILDHYKIVVISLDTGADEEFVSFTNSFIFKGRESGTYKALITSVGRNGTQSMPSVITFFVPEDVMLLEGSKNGTNTISNTVSDDFFLTAGHKIFIWGSFNIDKLIGGANVGNPEASIQLYRAEQGDPITSATLIQEIALFEATESATCLATNALGGGIQRPSLSGTASGNPDYARGTTFETCHSVMFTPISVASDDPLAGRAHTFFLKVIGRETPNDIVSLSITLWSANAGEGAEIPSDPFTPETPVVFPWHNCIEANAGDNDANAEQWLSATVGQNFNYIGNVFTYGVWVKWRRLSYLNSVPTVLSEMFGLVNPNTNFRFQDFKIDITRWSDIPSGSHYVETLIDIGDDTGAFGTWTRRDNTNSGNPDNFNPDVDPPYTSPTTSIWGGLNIWVLFFVTFDPTNGVEVYSYRVGKATPLTSPTLTDTTIGKNPSLANGRGMVWFAAADSLFQGGDDRVLDGTNIEGTRPAPCRVYAAGMWNKKLKVAEMTELYNNGNGSEINWREDGDFYNSSRNLIHYWQFGAIPDDLNLVGRDTGFNPLTSGGASGDLNLTATSPRSCSDQFTLSNVIIGDYPHN